VNYSVGVRAERYCFRKDSTKRVIAVSDKVSREIQAPYRVPTEKIVVIPPGVDSAEFNRLKRPNARHRVRARLHLNDQDFVALYVGADYRLKGLLTLLEAAVHVPQVNVLAVALRPDSALRKFIERNQLGARAIFLEPTNDIGELYTAADCFVLPTRYDTFSLSTLEAMASGLPVVVSRAAGVSEFLRSGLDSLVLERPDDVDSLTEYLQRLVNDSKLRANLSAAGRATAERHSWDDAVTRTLAVYRDVTATA
jgi:UDP-glucose:(heptosyl)LPS alpha-1,3-glucosyltransferase